MKFILIIAVFWGLLPVGQIMLNTEKSSILITGTSSLHDWEMTVEEFDVKGVISDNQIQNLEVTIKSKSMKSGKSVMDDKAYDAVAANDYPEITFSSKELIISNGRITGKGSLQIAGVKRTIDLDVKIVKNESSEMQLKGLVPLKMTDYNITPPTAMFGTLKTGDEVIIKYDISLTK